MLYLFDLFMVTVNLVHWDGGTDVDDSCFWRKIYHSVYVQECVS